MILAVDIGNTNIMFGCISDEGIHFVEEISTQRKRTVTEYVIILKSIFEMNNVSAEDIEGSIISSVVPELTSEVKNSVIKYLNTDVMVVGPGIKTGLNILIDNPAQLGSDLLVDSVAAVSEYNGPLIVVDMGTATVFCVINGKNQYIGVIIAPGIRTSLDSLVLKASLLPHISLERPRNIIGKNTAECMKSGIIFQSVSAVDGMIERIEDELGESCTIIATGASAGAIIPLCKRKDIILDENLLLKGLKVIYDKNRR